MRKWEYVTSTTSNKIFVTRPFNLVYIKQKKCSLSKCYTAVKIMLVFLLYLHFILTFPVKMEQNPHSPET